MTKADKVSVTMLDVGQGSGCFVAIYTGGTTTITATALLDLGSERAKTEAGGPSVNYIEKQLNSMTKPRIDFFSLSHSDSDHINLVQDLLARFDKPGTKSPKKPILEIGTVIYGGPRVQYVKHSSNNVITDVEGYQPKGEKKPEPLPSNQTSYKLDAPVKEIDEVKFYLLVGNHIAGEVRKVIKRIAPKKWRTDSYSLNTYSLIFVIVYDGWSYLITGDATGATISQANYVIKQYSVTFPSLVVLTMPHHSSETTTFGLIGSKRASATQRVSDEAKKVIVTFSNSLTPWSIHASAEEVGNFGHPSAYTMGYFWGHVFKTEWYKDPDPAFTGDQHLYNAYFTDADGYEIVLSDPTSKKKRREDLPPFDDWWTFGTTYAIFTNRYYVRAQTYDPKVNETATFPPDPGVVTPIPKSGAKAPPPFAVAWEYSAVTATGDVAIERLTNRQIGKTTVIERTLVGSFSRQARDAPATPEPSPAPAPPGAIQALELKPPARRGSFPPGAPRPGPPLRRMRLRDG